MFCCFCFLLRFCFRVGVCVTTPNILSTFLVLWYIQFGLLLSVRRKGFRLWFWSFGVWFCGTLRRSVELNFVCCFQNVSGPGFCISSCVEASWHFWIVEWSLGQQIWIPFLKSLEFLQNSKKFWLTRFMTNRGNLCFAEALDWGFTYVLQKTYRFSSDFSQFGLLMSMKVSKASIHMREWK